MCYCEVIKKNVQNVILYIKSVLQPNFQKMLKNSYPKNVQLSMFFAATYLYVVTQ